jgi:hypothetical protein
VKNLSDTLRIPIVAVGIREAIRALHADSQLASRFEPWPLPKWTLNEEFARLLASCERMLPFPEPSNLTSQAMATRLHSMSVGSIGELSRVLKKAAERAIRENAPRLTPDRLEGAEWVRLSDYRVLGDEL